VARCMEVGRGIYWQKHIETGVYAMTTTGELRAIIEDLELVDIGDAANYLGEQALENGTQAFEQTALLPMHDTADLATSNCTSCPC
jgi:hypothetical protein